MDRYVIGVVGNPNCGKTTLFNALTGTRQRVGNWPGVTVERKVGGFRHAGVDFELVDLPGTYSLDVSDSEVSLDEKIARDFVAGGEADVILNIVDASNLERNLYLSAQLLEMRVPTVVALNMVDVATERGISIDVEALARTLGCPVLPLVAARGEGLAALRDRLLASARERPQPAFRVAYPAAIERAVSELQPQLGSTRHGDSRWLALHLLETGDAAALASVPAAETLQRLRSQIEDDVGEEVDIALADARYGQINAIAAATLKRSGEARRSTSDAIDRIVLNRALGIPIFLIVMYLMFTFTMNVGGAFIDFFDLLFGALLVDGFGHWLSSVGAPDWMTIAFASGIGGGIQTVATFIPVIACLFLFLSWLEDSGYMARAAFVMDRFMRFIGLPGKAFVPMLVGFGCNVPAIMATRTLENERDRKLTVLMNPFMSCGARLPVYVLFAAAFFPDNGQNLVFGLYLLGVLAAVATGLVMKHTIMHGQSAPFVMELPPYHLPTLRGVLLRTWERLKNFVTKAGMVIVPMVLVLNFLNAIGTDGSLGHEDSEDSVLSSIGRTLSPVFAPMGIREDNWPATVGIFTGVLAKEAVVGTLNALYSAQAEDGSATADDFDLGSALGEAFASVPANLGELLAKLTDPLGYADATADASESAGAFGAMQARFDGQAGAFAYLLYILLYFPCAAATAAVFRETGLRWAAFVALWTTGLAYLAATVFYQAARFSAHPLSSAAWIGGMAASFVAVCLLLRYAARRRAPALSRLSPERA
ncbi:Fe(2+) transporter permease subunit FeoB [Plasticicumulans acidivorans]|uniref:Ferrous iron transport protein B n=1 Tax=Plasticicumulans acidivorans TaxID=886464 RepID=A0A317MWE2_9GAMM|nr:Fe(2+) transporter permease subunit FeoB [Plasticicumulans acidivorans]PWV63195.1 ferrous iron transport protein B [Plasticicumulans acidivorans]